MLFVIKNKYEVVCVCVCACVHAWMSMCMYSTHVLTYLCAMLVVWYVHAMYFLMLQYKNNAFHSALNILYIIISICDWICKNPTC